MTIARIVIALISQGKNLEDPAINHHIQPRNNGLFISSCRCFCSHRVENILIPSIFMTFGFAFRRACIVPVPALQWLVLSSKNTCVAVLVVLSGVMQE